MEPRRRGQGASENLGDSGAHLCQYGRSGPWKALGSVFLSTAGGALDPEAWAEPED